MTSDAPAPASAGFDAASVAMAHPIASHRQAVHSLLAIRDSDDLETALADVALPVAVEAVAVAAGLERKTELLWAMEDRQRRQVIEALPPVLVGALVQNLEDDNRYLLGDVSVAQFRQLLSLCSAERQFYWVETALSFTDVRANALPLLLPTSQLVEILRTRAEFDNHLRAIADYPIESARIPPDMLLDPAQAIVDLIGSENMLREFPIVDQRLEKSLQLVLDYDVDRYVDIVRLGLRSLRYAENHPLEWSALSEDPVLLDRLELAIDSIDGPVDEPDSRPDDDSLDFRETDEPPLALVPVEGTALMRLASSLPSAVRDRVGEELQALCVRQAVAEGGSLLLSDLQRAAVTVESYVLLGLRVASGDDPGRVRSALASRPLRKLILNGARVVERLRQVAMRLQPLDRVLDNRQRAIVRSLAPPRVTVVDGQPQIQLLPAEGLAGPVSLEVAASLLEGVAAWADLARALGLDRTAAALKAAGGTGPLLESLALSAALFGRIEFGLAEDTDRSRFLARYTQPGHSELAPEALSGLSRAVSSLGLGSESPRVTQILLNALQRLADG